MKDFILSSLQNLPFIAPQDAANGAKSPSTLACTLATEDTTGYDGPAFSEVAREMARAGKILVICTEQGQLKMANGELFDTGNHPVEMFVPMLHLANAGYDFDFVTPTGKPVVLEQWAMPEKDENVKGIRALYKDALSSPLSAEALSNDDLGVYDAVFIPGGHGALLGLPDDANVGRLLNWFFDNDRHMLSICHGPAAFLSMALNGSASPLKGYAIAAFPDTMDRITPFIGYMPGTMPWFFGEKLEGHGIEIVNAMANGTCHTDRRVITGDSPVAANDFGKMAAAALTKARDTKASARS